MLNLDIMLLIYGVLSGASPEAALIVKDAEVVDIVSNVCSTEILAVDVIGIVEVVSEVNSILELSLELPLDSILVTNDTGSVVESKDDVLVVLGTIGTKTEP